MMMNKNRLKQSSIYLLSNDINTDFDFYILVDSPTGRNRNNFLRKLQKYITSKNNNLLNSLNQNDPGLKILIERYPYRLFVAIDRNDDSWKFKGKTPLDDDFPWNEFNSEFIKKRICWIDKRYLLDCLKEENKDKNEDIVISCQNNENLLEHLDWREKFKLWLYYQWIKHLMKVYNIEKIHIQFVRGEEQEGISEVIDSGFFKDNADKDYKLFFNEEIEHAHQILIERHKNPIFCNPSLLIKKNLLYVEDISGSQLQYPLLQHAAIDSLEGLKVYFSIVENALNKIIIVDERFLKWFYNLSPKEKFSFFSVGIFPIEEFLNYKIPESQGSFFKITKSKVELEIKPELLEEIIKEVSDKWDNNLKEALLNFFCKNISTLIIHQGIIDEMLNFSHKDILDLKDYVPFILITSGRGKPDTLPKGEKFLPFANLDYLMKLHPDKLLFTRLMYKITEIG